MGLILYLFQNENCCKERERLEQSAKMQFYLDSGNKTLIAEANDWAAANPGCLPFSLELAFKEGET